MDAWSVSAPSVTITSPANGSTFAQWTSISLAGTASDAQDGNISTRIQWTDNGAAAGSGSQVSSVLSLAGIHTIVAKVTDNNGAQASSQVSFTVTVPTTSQATLTATKVYAKGNQQRVSLTWTGLTGSQVDVYRDNAKVAVVTNSGSTSNTVPRGPGTYSYFVCSAGTSACTNTVAVVF